MESSDGVDVSADIRTLVAELAAKNLLAEPGIERIFPGKIRPKGHKTAVQHIDERVNCYISILHSYEGWANKYNLTCLGRNASEFGQPSGIFIRLFLA